VPCIPLVSRAAPRLAHSAVTSQHVIALAPRCRFGLDGAHVNHQLFVGASGLPDLHRRRDVTSFEVELKTDSRVALYLRSSGMLRGVDW
jgi:hypothetical protein